MSTEDRAKNIKCNANQQKANTNLRKSETSSGELYFHEEAPRQGYKPSNSSKQITMHKTTTLHKGYQLQDKANETKDNANAK